MFTWGPSRGIKSGWDDILPGKQAQDRVLLVGFLHTHVHDFL